MTIPWTTILKQAPAILIASKELFEGITKNTTKKSSKKPDDIKTIVEELQMNVNELKANEIKQAELVAQMASQLKIVSEALSVISRRFWLLGFITLISIILSIYSVIFK